MSLRAAFEAASHEEAMRRYHELMGWEPYRLPEGFADIPFTDEQAAAQAAYLKTRPDRRQTRPWSMRVSSSVAQRLLELGALTQANCSLADQVIAEEIEAHLSAPDVPPSAVKAES